MERIGDTYRSKVDEPSEYHHSFFSNGKLWLFGTTYVPQPTYNWGNRVTFGGGYAIDFDPNTREWGQAVTFDALTSDENCGEAFFQADGAIFLFLYTAFGGFIPKALYRWNENERKWASIQLQIDASSEIPADPDRRVDVRSIDGNPGSKDGYFFVTIGSSDTSVHHIDFSSGKISKKFDVNPEAMLIPRGIPVKGVVFGDKLHVFYAVHGCGFRWEPARLVTLNLENGEGQEKQINGDLPRFGFAGARVTALRKNNEWLHIGGSIQKGMTGSEASRDVYSVNLGNEEPAWAKLPVEDSDPGEVNFGYDFTGDALYTVDKTSVKKSQL
ncbi:unnamed protein product, partial [Mesorhabditis belari]|uniref:Uncharacterized protein n=1 Tax=Mesorhabditis belari TaxID=2138241 RepID=A0AAF3J3B1_9BILA